MKTKLNCYIIDDEPLAQEILVEYISKVPFLELQEIFSSAVEASQKVSFVKNDLLFLDINMPNLDGLSYITILDSKPLIILTTAYDHYALRAFELAVKDYFFKPISFDRFYKGVFRIYQETKEISSNEPEIKDLANEKQFIFLKVGSRTSRILVNDIYFIEGMRDYLRIHTEKEKYMILISFQKISELLPSKNFVRVHKSYMVAIDKINHIEKNRIKMMNQIIPISETYRSAFFLHLDGM